MRAAPAVRKDGMCALKGCFKVKPTKSKSKDVTPLLLKDPFCSAVCCRKYFGVVLSKDEHPEMAHGSTAAQRLKVYGRGPAQKAA